MSAVLTTTSHKTAKSNKILSIATMSAALLVISGCQSLPKNQAVTTPTTIPTEKLSDFNINGKIGVTMPADTGTQGGSAFYAWGQQNERFAIELIGALGIGKTNIEYDGQTATLVSEKTGTLTADDPETLLQQATGWQAPISQMPYWISGRAAPSDSAPQLDAQNRLISSANGDWSASFNYKGNDKLPNKITAIQPAGHKVVMTINHQN
ncbi:lipoprotein insertase outer membrane protein LolB [Psychrobacter sp. M13]|uniref:lipoprotein insertase outer membrane protein LolB n=1 Tax=Psychrobacter sp. M13 TaxID=3067275 RepID=UPI00273B5E53|nr:lipoprotein insertase outer membrane protein LolB [Psychrobacter sp. M13]WLP94752.1 lipoprotein insertase outer membrane protein LolB [Psychrobacter sp. M13]